MGLLYLVAHGLSRNTAVGMKLRDLRLGGRLYKINLARLDGRQEG